MIAIKFGGTSMGSSKSIREVADIILKTKEESQVAVVVSAMSGVTDKLLKAARVSMQNKRGVSQMAKIIKSLIDNHFKTAQELINDPKILTETRDYIHKELGELQDFLEALAVIAEMSHASHDRIVAIGEKLSAKLLAAHLQDRGKNGAYVNLETVINGSHQTADTKFFRSLTRKLKTLINKYLKSDQIPVCTGFFGAIPGGIIEAVGRGYSDFCVSMVGDATNVERIEIWTDVDGIMSADPRVVKKAIILEEVSFNEAAEMSSFGAKVIHPKTIFPAVKKEIPVWIKNTFNPGARGTVITKCGKLSNQLCKAITSKLAVTVITLVSSEMPERYGYLAKIFKIMSTNLIPIDVVATSEISVSMTTDKNPKSKNFKKAITDLRKLGKVNTLEKQAIVCAIGKEMGESVGSGSKILASIATLGLNASVIARDAMKNNISCIVEEGKAQEVVRRLHKDILEKSSVRLETGEDCEL
jgi:aspartate kinase